ncbi:MAG: hypothetical protein KBT12_05055 [Bacteroidales bacterium]|nr:hypothetical protein [Candidatus Physcousia equi]
MKHILPSLLLALLLFSCKGKQTTQSSAADSTATPRTDNAQETASSLHPDLLFMQVHGPVKTITLHGCSYEFGRDGQLLTIDGTDPTSPEASTISVERDSEGRIVKKIWTDGWSDYVWQDGLIVSEYKNDMDDEYTYAFTYDNDPAGYPRLQSAQVEEKTWKYTEDNGYQETKQRSITYHYLQSDDRGNWLTLEQDNDKTERTITYYE